MPTSTLISNSARDINSVQPASSLCTGPDGALYVCYVGEDLSLHVIKRVGDVQEGVILESGSQANDAHQTGCICVDYQGYIHVTARTHNSPIKYWRSSQPYNIFTLEPQILSPLATANLSVSYPILTRAGEYVWLTYRTGTSGIGDTRTAIFEYTEEGGNWQDVHTPLITGFNMTPTDSQYLGCMRGLEDGSLLVIWTHRVNESEPVNRGLFFAQIYPNGQVLDASGIEVSLLASPIDRIYADMNLHIISLDDNTLTNSGLAVDVLDVSEIAIFHVAFSKHSSQGFREVYHARYAGTKWIVNQVTNHKRVISASTTICTVAPKPCDLSIQGPQMICKDGKVALFYTIPTRELRAGAWSRLPGEMHAAISSNNGDTWKDYTIQGDIKERTGEFQRSSTGEALLLHQEVTNPAGVLKVLDVSPILNLPSPALKVIVDLNGSQLEIPSSSQHTFTEGFALRFRFSPKRDKIMCLANKDEQFRVFFFGENGSPGNTFNVAGNLQIGVSGQVAKYYDVGIMKVGEWTDIVLSWESGESGSDEFIIYRNGEQIFIENLTFECANSVSPFIIGGFPNYPQYGFAGPLKFDYYSVPLTEAQVQLLYRLT